MPFVKKIAWVWEGFDPGGPDNSLPGGPVYPGNALPGAPGIDNSLPWAPGHPGNALPGRPGIWPPRPPTTKPPGLPVLPVDPGWDIPTDPPHPWLPGHWWPVDPGYGLPPVWGFQPVDPGFGVGGGGGIDNSLPGHWVPVGPDNSLPGCPDAKPRPLWLYIFHTGPEIGNELPAHAQPK